MTGFTSCPLLDYLKEYTKVNFLSDLCFLPQSKYQLLRNGINAVPKGSYSLDEWNNAVEYLLHEPFRFSSESEARDFLLKHFQ